MKTQVYTRIGSFTEDLIEDCRTLCEGVYDIYHMQMEQDGGLTPLAGDGESGVELEGDDDPMEHDSLTARLFGLGPHASSSTIASARNELDIYLSRPVEIGVDDPLKWWKHQQALGEFPVLCKVARDYLAVPGMQYDFTTH